MKRYAPIPLVQPSGIQPYHEAGGQLPGPALLAMLAGRTFSGLNPQDAVRGAQVAARQPATLLARLSGTPMNAAQKIAEPADRRRRHRISPPGSGGGGYEITPDNLDRRREAYWRAVRTEQARRERAATRRARGLPPHNFLPWDDRPTNS